MKWRESKDEDGKGKKEVGKVEKKKMEGKEWGRRRKQEG